jgi:hypothetical protein
VNRCDICRGEQVLIAQDPNDQKFRCGSCCSWLERLTPMDRRFLRSLQIGF